MLWQYMMIHVGCEMAWLTVSKENHKHRMNFGQKRVLCLGAILLLRKENSGWVGSLNAYNCLSTLHKEAIFGTILLLMTGMKILQKNCNCSEAKIETILMV